MRSHSRGKYVARDLPNLNLIVRLGTIIQLVRPEMIGPYRIVSQLGMGGMGEVFLAYDNRLRRQVAIKQIRLDAELTFERRERLRREAQAVAGLSHPNIVQVHDLLTIDDIDYVVMEFAEGPVLSDLLADGPLSLDEALRLAQEIAAALAEAHSKSIVHRDLKAENIIVTAAGHAKILDFGLAKSLDKADTELTLSTEGTVLGTCRSMSPEQALGAEIDHRADLFSFGSLLYLMVTGKHPFVGSSPLLTLGRIMNTEPEPVQQHNPDVDDQLAELIGDLLRKKPEDRPQTAGEVVARISQIAGLPLSPSGALPVHTWTASGVRTPSDRSRNRYPSREVNPAIEKKAGNFPRRFVVLGSTFVAALVALLVYFILPGRSANVLRIAVPAPRVDGTDLDLAAAGIRIALLRGLIALEGVDPLDPSEVDPLEGSPRELARATAADEVVMSRVTGDGRETMQVELYRMSSDGAVLWTEAFEAPTNHTRLLADAVLVHLRRGFPDHDLTSDLLPDLDISNEDYEQFLMIRAQYDAADKELNLPEILLSLEKIRNRSPRFIETHLLEATVSGYLFETTQDPGYRDHGRSVIDKAIEIAPLDPRPLLRSFRLVLLENDFGAAESTLEKLNRLDPSDVQVLASHALLLEAKGDAEEGLALLGEAVKRRPSWSNLQQLALMEIRHGKIAAARMNLKELLRRVPGHPRGRSTLAELELLHGSMNTAEYLYDQLCTEKPSFVCLSNLGLARLLLGNYSESMDSFLAASEMQPNSPIAILNLADSLLLVGDQQGAREMYERTLELTANPSPSSHWSVLAARAQALAHLGRPREAVAATQALLESTSNTDALHIASLVYTLVGDQTSALVFVSRAMERGLDSRWFSLPWFDPLRARDEFTALLESARE